MNNQQTITLGDHPGIPVVPQRHARLRHQLSPEDFERLMSSDYAAESYRLLCVLIPAIKDTMPLWEYEGYGSQEAMDAGEYHEESDRSPTTDEIINAFEVAFQVSGAGRMGKIIDLIQAGAALQT